MNNFVDYESNRQVAISVAVPISTLPMEIPLPCLYLSDFLHFVQLLPYHDFRAEKIINFIKSNSIENSI